MASDSNGYLRRGSMQYAAAKIGVSIPTIYKLIKSKKLRVYRIGRAVRVTDEAISDCISDLEADTQAATL